MEVIGEMEEELVPSLGDIIDEAKREEKEKQQQQIIQQQQKQQQLVIQQQTRRSSTDDIHQYPPNNMRTPQQHQQRPHLQNFTPTHSTNPMPPNQLTPINPMPPNNNNVVIDSSLANHGENEMDNLYRSSTVNISVVNHLLAWMKLPDNINNNAIIEATVSAVSDILLGIYRQFKNTRSKEARLLDKSYFQQFGGATNKALEAVQPMIAKMFAEHGGNGVNHQQVVAELEEKISDLRRANDALVQENDTIREERDALLQQRKNNNQQEDEEDELSDDESTDSVDVEYNRHSKGFQTKQLTNLKRKMKLFRVTCNNIVDEEACSRCEFIGVAVLKDKDEFHLRCPICEKEGRKKSAHPKWDKGEQLKTRSAVRKVCRERFICMKNQNIES